MPELPTELKPFDKALAVPTVPAACEAPAPAIELPAAAAPAWPIDPDCAAAFSPN